MGKMPRIHSDGLSVAASITAAVLAAASGILNHDWLAVAAGGFALAAILPAKIAADAKAQQFHGAEATARHVEDQAQMAFEAALAASSNGPPLW